MRRPDVIRWVIDWMMANEAAISEDLALRCERAARAEWGGQRVDYIAKTCAADGVGAAGGRPRKAAMAAISDYIDGRPLPEISQAHGVSRATLYRALKRR
jgi:transcriptional regulator of acetoin/glycerol metabolism